MQPTDMIAQLPALAEADAWLIHRGRRLTVDLLVEIGDTPFHLAIAGGRIARLERGPILMRPFCFAIRGDTEGWREFWRPAPKPTWHDLFALTKLHGFRIEGDLVPFMSHLLYFKDLMALPRKLAGAA
jgi:hypothetical protein